MLFLCYTLPPAVTASDQRIHFVLSGSPCRETSSPLPQNAELEERGDGLMHLELGHWRDSGSLVEEALWGMMALCSWEYFVTLKKSKGKESHRIDIVWYMIKTKPINTIGGCICIKRHYWLSSLIVKRFLFNTVQTSTNVACQHWFQMWKRENVICIEEMVNFISSPSQTHMSHKFTCGQPVGVFL